MPVVSIPNVGRVSFPDSMSQDDITTAIERDILKRQPIDQIVRRPETGGAAGAVGPVMDAGPTLGQGAPSPFTIGQPPSGLEDAQAAVETQRARAQTASVGQPTIEIGAQPATVPRFGKPGTFVGEASGMVAGLGEWALNNPEEFLASIYPPTQAAVALRYAPSIVAQAVKDAVSAAKGDTGALGRLAALSAMVLGPKGVEAARAKYLAEGPPGMPLPNVDAMARASFRDQPALALHETLLPRSAEAVKQIERTPDASSQPKTTAEDGNLRTQPERVVGQMPVEEGGSGVQPQTEGRLPETPPGTLTPAIQVQGKTFTGEDHLAAYENAKTSGQPDTSGAQEGFVNDKGGFLTREEAAKQTGLPTETEPGKLHSSDLESKPPPSSSETVPQTEAPAAAAVSKAEASGVSAPEAPPATSKPTPLEPLTQASSAGTEGETQAQRGTETPAAQVERPGATKRGPVQRPWDIIDEIESSVGKIRNKKNARPGSEGYYGDAYANASRGAGRGLFAKEGQSPDSALDALKRSGILPQDAIVEDLWGAIERASGQRRAIFQGQTPEIQADKFQAALEKQGKVKGSHFVSVGDLAVGDKFRVGTEELEVTSIDPDTGEVTVKDGRKFGVQTIPDGADVPIAKGSLQAGPQTATFTKEDFSLNAPESVEQQKARLAHEEEVQKRKAEREKMEAAVAKPLIGSRGDIGQGDLLGGGDLLSGGLTGMGGAVPGEFKPSAEGATAMKYRLIDQERVQRGLEPLTKPEGRADQEVLDRAKAAIDADPGLPERLVSELRNKPRPIEDWENHVLLLRKIDLRNEYAKATRDISQAFDDGREEDLVAAKVRRAEWSDKLTELEQASRKAGSERGRALRALRVMANEDFSLASMESELRGIKGGERLTPEETSKIEQISREYQAKVSALEQHNAELGQKLAQAEADKALAELKARAAKPPGVSDYVLKTAESWVKKWEGEAAQARTRLAGKFLSPTPADLLDLAKIVRFRIGELGLDVARITAELVADFGEGVKPYITGAIETAQKMIDELAAKTPRGADVRERVKETGTKGAAPTVETVSAKIKAKAAKGELSEISPLVQKLARMFVEQGINTRDALVESVHNVLKDIVPDITPRETMDAISGYGQFKALTKDQISVQLRDLKGQMQQIGKLEDMAEKKAPLKTGVERRTPSDEERRLIKLVNEAKKKGGFQITDPATQLRSALQAVQTRLRNQIVDLQQEIDTRQRVVKERRTLQYDDVTKALVAQRDALKAQHDEIFGKRQLTDQQRIAMAMRALEKSIADYNERIAKGDIAPRRTISKTPQTPEIVAATARRDALRAQLNEMRELAKPKTTPEQRALKAFKTRTANRIADLQEKMAAGDFSTRKRAPVQLDEEGIRLKASLDKTTKDFDQLKRQTELADRSRWQKVLDRFVRWERAFKLSSPVVFGKLSAAALTRGVTTGAEEVLGAGLGKLPLIRDVARQAPREGGLNVPAMAHALTAAFTKGLKDAAQTATRGLADLDIVHGDKLIDKDWVNFFGQLHGMLKAPVKRAEFTLALEKRMAFEMNKGVDVTNPLAQARIASEALNDGYRAIFMQHGFSSDMFNQFVSQLERSKKYQPQGEISARLARFLFPVVRVPANIIAETATGVYGAPMASARTMVAAVKGRLGSLDPVVADSIMRQFKKGSIGLGLMAVGYFTPEMIGGYDWREKRAPGSVKTGGFQVAGVDVPRWMTHAPWFELMQFGATIRHVKDQHLARTGEEKGISEGMWAAGLGLIEETPFVGNMLRVDKLWATKSERDRYVGELIKSTIEPALLQRIAEWTDAAEKRRPASVSEQVKMGIPGLRQDVPEDFRAR